MDKTKILKELNKYNFNENQETWIVTGDSYSIKDELKAAGARYSDILCWHFDHEVEEYAERLVKVKLAEVGIITAWNTICFNADAKSYVKNLIKIKDENAKEYSFFGEIKEKFYELPVTFVRKIVMQNVYGSSLYIFENDKHCFCWFTATNPDIETGESVKISGTVKDHSTYNDVNQTIVTRVKVVKNED